MAARVIAQLIVNGASIFTRAFVTAYQQAVRNAKAGGGAAAGGAAARSIKLKMSPEEALQVLHIERHQLTKPLLDERYKRLFDSNDPAKGGSFYVQSKVFRSKEALDRYLEESTKGTTGADADSTKTSEGQSPGDAKAKQ